MKQSLTPESIQSIRTDLTKANQAFTKAYPGAGSGRQPIHTVYGGAQIFTSETAKKMSASSLKALNEMAPNADALVKALGLEATADKKLWQQIYERIVQKLEVEAVEDFRIDFEDGYGNRPDSEEDGHAESTAKEVAKGMQQNSLPPFIGIRIKTFSEECVKRSLRTLDIFLSTLLSETKGNLPSNFVVTLPKVILAEQCATLVKALEEIEKKNNLKANTLKYEFMVETPQAIIGFDGKSPIRSFVEAGKGRCVGAHFGTYDYTAGCGITANYQTMDNPVCDFAKHVMQVSLMGTNLLISDGATNVMPVGTDPANFHKAWRLSYKHIRHSLSSGFYQGWDLHPNQLPVRYAATYAFFLEALDSASDRLKGFVEKAAKATLLGDIFDDAATGQGLLNFFLRALSCGAITKEEALKTGLSIEEIQSRSFLKILEGRKKL